MSVSPPSCQLSALLLKPLCPPFCSLVNSIIYERAFSTKGSPDEISTVGIDLLRHRLKGTTVEFYDCAGQVDYAGLHQTFLSRRALYLLVFDVRRCQDKLGDEDALDEVLYVREVGVVTVTLRFDSS